MLIEQITKHNKRQTREFIEYNVYTCSAQQVPTPELKYAYNWCERRVETRVGITEQIKLGFGNYQYGAVFNGSFAASGHMVHAGGQAAHWDIQNKATSSR